MHVLIVTASDAVARWAAKPVNTGGGNTFTPMVIGPAAVPEILDEDQARADPELAVLSAMAHGEDQDVTKAARIAAVAQRVCRDLDTEHGRLYFDLIHHHLSEAARRALGDMMPANYEYQSDFARKYYGQGKAEGIADIVGKLLSLRFGPLDETTRSRIAAASSTELEEVAERLLTAPTLDAALDPGNNNVNT